MSERRQNENIALLKTVLVKVEIAVRKENREKIQMGRKGGLLL
jgi:hypothetical protein